MEHSLPSIKQHRKRGVPEPSRAISGGYEYLCSRSALSRLSVALLAAFVGLSALAFSRLQLSVQESLRFAADNEALTSGYEPFVYNSSGRVEAFEVVVPMLAVQSELIGQLEYGSVVVGVMQRNEGQFVVHFPVEGVVSVFDAEIGLRKLDLVGLSQAMTSICAADNFLANTDLKGGDIHPKGIVVPNALQCCQRCAADVACAAWTFDRQHLLCWLKKSSPKASKAAGLISGRCSRAIPVAKPQRKPLADTTVLAFDDLAANWTRAHLIGNGQLGAIVGMYMQPELYRIPISSDRIYGKQIKTAKPTQISKLDVYRKVKQFMLEGNLTAAEKIAAGLSGGTVAGFEYAADLWFNFGAMDDNNQTFTQKKLIPSSRTYIPFTPANVKQPGTLLVQARRSLRFDDGVAQESILTHDDAYGDASTFTAHHREWFVSNEFNTLIGRMSCRAVQPFPSPCLQVDIALGRDDAQQQKRMRMFEVDFSSQPVPIARQLDLENVQPKLGHLLLELEIAPKPSALAPTIVTYLGIDTDGLAHPFLERTSSDIRIRIRNATNILSVTSTCVFYAHEADSRKTCKKQVVDALMKGYWANRADHIESFRERYRGTALEWHAPATGDYVWKLLQMYNLGRYLALSSTHPKAQPMNLQGIWADGLSAAWNGDYHMNINFQMAYWPLPAFGSLGATPSFYRFLDDLMASGAVTAREMYGARGWVAHGYTDIWMATTPWDEMQWSLCISCGAWIAVQAWDIYLHNMEGSDVLSNTLFPALRGALLFLQDNLFQLPDGTWVTGPTTSPETSYEVAVQSNLRSNSVKRQFHHLTFGPTFDITIFGELIEAYDRCIALMRMHEFAVSAEDSQVVVDAKSLLASMPNRGRPLLNSDNLVAEYTVNPVPNTSISEPDAGHRHFSSLIGLFPFSGDFFDDPAALKAAANTVNHKINNGGAHTNWSAAWAAALFARLFDGNSAWRMLQSLMDKFTMDNGLTVHPVLEPIPTLKCPTCFQAARKAVAKKGALQRLETRTGEKFQVDASMGLMAAVHEMLVQSHRPRVIQLLPALPEQLAVRGELKGLSLRGGAIIDLQWDSGRVATALLQFTESYDRYCRLFAQGSANSCVIALTTPNTLSLEATSCVSLVDGQNINFVEPSHVPPKATLTYFQISAFPCEVRFLGNT